MNLLKTLLTTFVFIFTCSVQAQTFNNLLSSDLADLELGGGYVVGSDYREEFDGDENDTYKGLAPLFRARLLILNVGNVPGLVEWENEGFRMGTVTNYTGAPYETTGIEERDRHFFAGGYLGYGPFVFFAYTDVGNTSNGTIYNFRYSKLLADWGDATLHMGISGILYNRQYVDFFYGISEEEVSESPHFQSPYKGEETYSSLLEFVYNQPLAKNWRFTAWLNYQWFDQGVSNSPTVQSPHWLHGGIGVLYEFF